MSDAQLTLVETFEEVEEFFRWLGNRRQFLAFDTETEGLSWWSDALRTVQFGDAGHGWVFPWDTWGKGVALEVLRRYDGNLVGANVKFDALYLKKNGVDVPWERLHDTRAMAHLIDSSKPTGLKPLAVRYLDPSAASAEAELKKAMIVNKWSWATVPIDFPPYWLYAALDTVFTAQLAELLYPAVQGSYAAVYDLELASTHVLANMEWYGALIDVPHCRRLLVEWDNEAVAVQQECLSYGLENPGADRQVADALVRNGARLTKVTKGGQFSVDKEVLATLDHPLAELVRRYRRLVKWSSTYLGSFIELKDRDDLVHANVNPLGARTGRMSCSRPNLQNLPRDASIRDAFVAREGHALVIADFAQIEMRLMAHFARETTMLEAFDSGVDLHTFVAQQVYQTSEPTRQMRQIAKSAAFAKIYGAGTEKFALTAGVNVEAAAAFLQMYDQRFPRVRPFMQAVTDAVRDRSGTDRVGWVRAPSGRVHRVSVDEAYKATNYLVQGTAADVMKAALVRLDMAGLAEYAVMPVHDEVVLDAPLEDAADLLHEVEQVMSEPDQFAVPLTVEGGVYDRWGTKYRE